jgi:acetoin utilization protein AcuC
MSGHAHLDVLRALLPLAPRFVLMGGGGYNPWGVGRLWTAAWGVLSGREIPERLPGPAQAVLRGLEWRGQKRVKMPPEAWLTSLVDPPRPGAIPDMLRARVAALEARLVAWV